MSNQAYKSQTFLFDEPQQQQQQSDIIQSSNEMNQQSSQIKIQQINLKQTVKDTTTHYQDTRIVIVQPLQKKVNKDQHGNEHEHEDGIQNIQLTYSTSVNQVKIQQGKTFLDINGVGQHLKSSSSIVFQSESDYENQQNPQSSLRKLYNSPKKQMEMQNKEINVVNNEKYSLKKQKISQEYDDGHQQYYQQDGDDYQQKLDDKIPTRKNVMIQSNNIFDLIHFKLPQASMIKAVIKIESQSIFSLQRTFHFYLRQERRLLMIATKPRFRFASKYQIVSKFQEQLGVVVSNVSRTQYRLVVIKKKKQLKEQETTFNSNIIKLQKIPQQTEQEHDVFEKCYLAYGMNIFKFAQLQVQILQSKKIVKESDKFSDLKTAFTTNQKDSVDRFTNKMAQKDKMGNYVLNFNQKLIVESAKNMIVENQFGQTCMVFGKYQDNVYLVNVYHPFSLIEAFFVGISHLDRKILVK